MAFRYKNVLDIVRTSLDSLKVSGEYIMVDNLSLLSKTDPKIRHYASLLRDGVQFILSTVPTPEVLGLTRSITILNSGENESIGLYEMPSDVYRMLSISDGVHRYGFRYEHGDNSHRNGGYNGYTYTLALGNIVIDNARGVPPQEIVLKYVSGAVYRVTLGDEGTQLGMDFTNDKDIVLIDYNLVSKAFKREYAKVNDDTALASLDYEYKHVLAQVTGDNTSPSARIDVRG